MPKTSDLPPSILVIFGITGDLSRRYILPALYHLTKNGVLHKQTLIVGITRRNVTADELLNNFRESVVANGEKCDAKTLDKMSRMTSMVQMDLDEPAAYDELLNKLNRTEEGQGLCMDRLYYLSIPPQA